MLCYLLITIRRAFRVDLSKLTETFFNLLSCRRQEFHINPMDMHLSPTQITIQTTLSSITALIENERHPLATRMKRSEFFDDSNFNWQQNVDMVQWLYIHSRYGSYEQPVKQNIGQYKNQPGRIEHYTPGKSSVSDKEAKQVTQWSLPTSKLN